MFHLTPQERSIIATVLAILIVGGAVHAGLTRDIAMFHWVKHPVSRPKLPDINTANAGQLAKLPGIGPKTAQNIVAYRQEHGPFQALHELAHVKGVTKIGYKKMVEAYAHP